MISTEYIYQRVNDLSRKGQGGYNSSEEFNNNLESSQNLLQQFWYDKYEEEQVVTDALRPFVAPVNVLLDKDGIAALPSDYRHKIDVGVNIVTNSSCGEKPSRVCHNAHFLNRNELKETLRSPIRKPDIDKKIFKYIIDSRGVVVYPKMSGSIELTYLRYYKKAQRGFTVNPVTVSEDPDPVTTIDLEWEPSQVDNIIDLMLFHKGIQIRETALLQWVGLKKNFLQVTNKSLS